jgi:hypothetical protein
MLAHLGRLKIHEALTAQPQREAPINNQHYSTKACPDKMLGCQPQITNEQTNNNTLCGGLVPCAYTTPPCYFGSAINEVRRERAKFIGSLQNNKMTRSYSI